MKNNKLIIKTKSKNYPIYFGNNILNTTGRLVKKNIPGVKKICIISDNKLPKFLLNKLIEKNFPDANFIPLASFKDLFSNSQLKKELWLSIKD